ncbi:MAG: PorT family protein [Cyclobacteriaceae bacterium]|nr:PorT family protein [Cyclobacteriaceae bacterium]
MTSKNNILLLTLFSTLLACVTFQSATAQGNSTRRAGIKGGLNVSNLFVDNVSDENARLGYNVGIFGELVSSESFALQAELLFSTKGSTNQYGSPFNQEIKYNLNYIDLPLLAVFKLGAVDFHLGGYASYLVGSTIAYKGDFINGVDQIDKDNLKSFDYGLVGGLAVNFGALQVGARYNYGLVKIADSNAAEVLIGDSKNSVAQLYLAINLNSKR